MTSHIQRRPQETGVEYLRRLLRENDSPEFHQMVEDQLPVQRRYGRVFHPDNLHGLSEKDFKKFLLYEHNRHWWGIHRQQAQLVSDMDRLRATLAVLLDDTQPIEKRINFIEPSHGPKPIPGLGKAVFTPILHVAYPDQYGVWNSVSEGAMQRLGMWPAFGWGATFGQKYVHLNRVLNRVSSELGIDLWTLDSLWWLAEKQHEPTKHRFNGGIGAGRGSARVSDTFLCPTCYQGKAIQLQVPETGLCTDCS